MSLLIGLVILGVVFYFIDMIPMADPIPKIIKAVLIIIAIVMVLQWLGVVSGLPSINLR